MRFFSKSKILFHFRKLVPFLRGLLSIKPNTILIIEGDSKKRVLLLEKITHYYSENAIIIVASNWSFKDIIGASRIYTWTGIPQPWKFLIELLDKVNDVTILNPDTDTWMAWSLSKQGFLHYLILNNESELTFIKRHEERFNQFISECSARYSDKAYIFGTGPSIVKASFNDFQDGFKIVCNSFAKNKEAWAALQPDVIVATDAVFYFGSNIMSLTFLHDVGERLAESDSFFLYPQDFHPVVSKLIPKQYEKRLIAIPRRKTRDMLVMKRQFELSDIGNTLNTMMLPIACTFSKNVFLWGFDGQNPENVKNENGLIWSHANDFSYDDFMDLIKLTDKAFIDFHIEKSVSNDYVKEYHGDELDQQLSKAEAEGYSFVMMHDTFTQSLKTRFVPDYKGDIPYPRIKVNSIRIPDSERPQWSIMIPTYNCAQYLRGTLQSVLQQDQGSSKMQIEVIDDFSTLDNPEEVVNELGANRVAFFKQPHNKGHNGNFDTCLNRSIGKYIHQLHGDDRVFAGYYERVTKVFESDPTIGAVFTRFDYVDEYGKLVWCSESLQEQDGILDDYLRKITNNQIIQTPSISVRREVYEKIGAFDKRLNWCEDWEMWARVASNYKIGYVNEVLAEYRIHSSSNTGKYISTGENLRDLQRGIKIISSYVNYMPKGEYLNNTMDYYANYGIDTMKKLLIHKDLQGVINQYKEISLMSRENATIIQAIETIFDNLEFKK
jgi:glycosyltransferase involved in cell wall biosynthesis